MKTVKELLEEGYSNIKISILVFGPQVKYDASDQRTRDLQGKRRQIRESLEQQGHMVKYAEDIVDPKLSSYQSNAFLQEIVIMREFDLIVTLVESPGSNVELGLIASRPDLAIKSSLFIDNSFRNGLAASACEAAELQGADFNTFQYPVDLTDCNLLGFVKDRVRKVQLLKLTM